MENIILNSETNKLTSKNIENISVELKKGINNLKGNFFDLETGNVNYKEMKGSEAFEEYKAITQNLNAFDLNTLTTMEAKLSFWINIYNVLVVHGIIELDIKNSVNEVSGFFEKVSYKIDKYVFSLDNIEHGILRGNIKKHLLAGKPFGSNDPRLKFSLGQLEQRIHFALVCGSKSCPPIGTYQEEKIDQQLDIAAGSFINGEDVLINKDKMRLTVSKIFKWYKKDFGSNKDLVLFLAKYRKNQDEKNFLLNNAEKISINYLDYNWNLNH